MTRLNGRLLRIEQRLDADEQDAASEAENVPFDDAAIVASPPGVLAYLVTIEPDMLTHVKALSAPDLSEETYWTLERQFDTEHPGWAVIESAWHCHVRWGWPYNLLHIQCDLLAKGYWNLRSSHSDDAYMLMFGEPGRFHHAWNCPHDYIYREEHEQDCRRLWRRAGTGNPDILAAMRFGPAELTLLAADE